MSSRGVTEEWSEEEEDRVEGGGGGLTMGGLGCVCYFVGEQEYFVLMFTIYSLNRRCPLIYPIAE